MTQGLNYRLLLQLITFYITRKINDADAKSFESGVLYVAKMFVVSHLFDNTLSPDRGFGKVFDLVSIILSLALSY